MRFACVAVLVAGCGDDPVHMLPDAPVARDASVDAPPDPCLGAFDDDLLHGLGKWTVTQTTPGLFTVTADATGVHVRKTGASPGGFQSVAFTLPTLQPSTNGAEIFNFTLAVDFANAVIGPGEDQIELHPVFSNGSTFFAVYSNHGGTGAEVHVWDGTSVQASTPTTATSGTHEIDRMDAPLVVRENGATIYTAPASSTASGDIPRGAAFTVNLQPGSDDAVAVDFTNFHATWSCAYPI